MIKRLISRFFKRIPHSAKYVVWISAVAALAFLFPANAKFKYRFGLGQTWLYDDLYANFEFAIKKTDAELAREREVLAVETSPYFVLDLETIRERKKLFEENLQKQLRMSKAQFPDVARNTEGYVGYGQYVLSRLLNKGVLQSDTIVEGRDKQFVINVLRGNVAEKQTLENCLTPEKVREWLNDSLPFSRLKEPEFLLPLLEPFLTPNLIYNTEKTRAFEQQELEKITTSRGMVKNGELIVAKGSIISDNVFQKLESYKGQVETNNLSSQKYRLVFLGYLVLTALILGLYFAYLRTHAQRLFVKLRWLFFLLGWVVLYTYLMYGITVTNEMNPYLIPFCIAPIVIKNFHRRELALVTHVCVILMVGLITTPGYEFILLQLLAGFVATFARFETRYWGNFFKNIFTISLVYMLGYVGLSLIEEVNFSKIDWSVLSWLALNGFLTLLAYPLIPLLGGFFGFTSSITLAELSDLNHPLLKEMSLKAPGTLQHSLQVSNLAELAAKSVGADDLLVKVAALYHDIGKMLKPMYFIENQPIAPDGKSTFNPHNNLSYDDSARVIIEHVTEGGRMAERHNLPRVIIDFIWTHHGTTFVEYFYRLHLRTHEAAEGDKKIFQYPGPIPRTKEETILMLADSLEASSKSLRNPDAQAIDDLVEKIVQGKIDQKQLHHSALSFQDLELCKRSFKQTLKNIHHLRVEYPAGARRP